MSISNSVLKILVALITAVVIGGIAMWALPALADHGIKLTPLSVGAADIEVNSDGSLLALVYYKRSTGSGSNPGAVFIKSADQIKGWRTRPYPLGFTLEPPRLAFNMNTPSTVYVAWLASDGNEIRYARCTLSKDTFPVCPEIGLVYNTTQIMTTLDIAVDGNGNIHLVWANEDLRNIQTALIASTQNLPLAGTDIVNLSPGANAKFFRPRLAAAGGRVHLAYLHASDSTNSGNFSNPHEVIYQYSDSTPTHSWTGNETFNINMGGKFFGGGLNIDKLGHPVLAAAGAKVYLAFEALTDFSSPSPQYALIGAESVNSGVDWATPQYITSALDTSAFGPIIAPPRLSVKGGVPGEEDGLRPGVAISGTGYAIVWQQRPSDGCNVSEGGVTTANSSSEIYAAYNGPTWLGAGLVTDGVVDEYAISPDIAVAPDGTRHIAFMQYNSTETDCGNGEIDEYAITYTGPFTETENDEGEGGIFLPIIVKS